jgi:hypothetical protein
VAQLRVQHSSSWIRHGSEMGAAWLIAGAAWLSAVRRGSVAGAAWLTSARCKAGPSLNPDSAPQGGVCH